MRQILFRGKRKGTPHEWVYGDLNYIDGKPYVFDRKEEGEYSPEHYEVIPETVGQYTGYEDRNGVSIFERDKLSNGFGYGNIGTVIFEHGAFYIKGRDLNSLLRYFMDCQVEIIGNIHE